MIRLTSAFVAAAIALPVLAGCGVVAKVNARSEMEESKALYKACLAQSGPSACEAQRLSYAADMSAYRATTAGLQLGRSATININEP